MKAVRN